MIWKPSRDEGILISSALVCIWMLLIVFITQQQRYDYIIINFQQEEYRTDAAYIHISKQRAECAGYYCFTDNEFVELFDDLDENRAYQEYDYTLFDNPDVNEYVNAIGESRGYSRRSYANEDELIEYNDILTYPFVRDAYVALRNEMQQEQISLHFVSGYRDFEDQKRIFLQKLGSTIPERILTGEYDEELNSVLDKTAPPGYSKHHTGYAVDFGCGDNYLVFEFLETECYDWMSYENFSRVKKYGFIPSYPQGVEYQGPNPEPWEYVWVGTGVLQ